MSTAVVIPPPNSSSLLRHVPRLTARARQLLTAVNLHYAGVAALAVLNLFLVAHLVLAWQEVNSTDANALAQQRAMLTSAKIANRPLEGIDAKLKFSNAQADSFYAQRLPFAFSQVLTQLGTLTSKSGVRLSRVQYAYGPVLSGPYALTEVRMDASVSGEYRAVIGAINALERSKLFFAISSITLTGQQTGQVNLRLRVVTYLRAAGAGEVPGEAPAGVTAEPADASAAQTGGRP